MPVILETTPEPVTILGRVIGRAKGWAHIGDTDVVFYYFEPISEIALPAGNWNILWEVGKIAIFTPDGTFLGEHDIIETLKNLPQAPETDALMSYAASA